MFTHDDVAAAVVVEIGEPRAPAAVSDPRGLRDVDEVKIALVAAAAVRPLGHPGTVDEPHAVDEVDVEVSVLVVVEQRHPAPERAEDVVRESD